MITTLRSLALADNVEFLIYDGASSASFTGTGNSLYNTIYGWGGNDMLSGGAGNDYLDGSSGFDTGVFTGANTDYTISALTDGLRTVIHTVTGEVDTLHSIEQGQFQNGTFVF